VSRFNYRPFYERLLCAQKRSLVAEAMFQWMTSKRASNPLVFELPKAKHQHVAQLRRSSFRFEDTKVHSPPCLSSFSFHLCHIAKSNRNGEDNCISTPNITCQSLTQHFHPSCSSMVLQSLRSRWAMACHNSATWYSATISGSLSGRILAIQHRVFLNLHQHGIAIVPRISSRVIQ
jgi:hypothetical protein